MKSKIMNKRREAVGMPPLELKKKELVTPGAPDQQYNALDPDVEFMNTIAATKTSLDVVAVGATNTTRESNTIKFLPFVLRFEQIQLNNTELHYRLMVIQVFSKHAGTDLRPDYILVDPATDERALRCNYLEKADRPIKFKVWYDKLYLLNTDGDHPNRQTRFIKIPGHTVTYDPDVAAGTEAEGKMFFVVVTNAPISTADYQFSVTYASKFLDQ